MKAYVQYLDYSPVSGALHEPCGDRAVVILDGRRTLSGWIEDARECNGYRRPVYPHFQIMRGDFREFEIIYSTVK
jgi:hypothetical protein